MSAATSALPAPLPRRADLPFRRKALGVGLLVAATAGAQAISGWRDTHGVLINASHSLPNWAFLVETGRFPTARGEYVIFAPRRTPLVVSHFGPDPQAFAKIVHGLPGDLVTREGPVVSVNGAPVARLKPRTRKTETLQPGPLGRVPDRCLFVATPHKDGFDSRYAEIGWVCEEQIVGIGTPVL